MYGIKIDIIKIFETIALKYQFSLVSLRYVSLLHITFNTQVNSSNNLESHESGNKPF